ncbi:unnamed protein product [Caenorhabditis sp. 36 PRJEB53466]|nr:unnamed protein product [Caenorhabditis sp. 36 PRJEB53466]
MKLPGCEMPGIPINPSNVEIVGTPAEFYQTLIDQSKKAKKRIALSSLYLGDGEHEKKLVSTIRESIDNANVEVTVLLDMLRGTRRSSSGESSVSVLQPISDKAKIFLYHTPELSGFLKRVFPERADEIIGLQHMKLYIFDDSVLISGANLSCSYFTDRIDRYFLFKNCKPLADFFHEIITTVGDSSFIVQNRQILPSSKCDIHPYLGDSRLYRELLKSRIERVIANYQNSQNSDETDSNTWIFPILQMGLLGINQEFNLLQRIFSSKDSTIKMTMASGYFNFIEDYEDLIFDEGNYEMNILTASPFANGFYKSKGFSKYIPPLYSNICKQFLERQSRSDRSSVKLHEYFRDGWTFHAKGLWMEQGNQMTTFVGSSNYGYRSVHRDLEAQVVVVTSEEELLTRLSQEKNKLFEHSSLLDIAALQKPEHYVPTLVRVVSKVFRSFL